MTGEFGEFVTAGRCPCCGHIPGMWTPGAIVDSLRVWTAEHGNPPSVEDWTNAGPGHPSYHQVRQIFGSMKTARIAAGVVYRRRNHAGDWTRGQVFDAFARWSFTYGRLPRRGEWLNPPEGFPSAHRVKSLFGSWAGALVACGYTPPRRVRSAKSYAASMAAVTKRGVAA